MYRSVRAWQTLMNNAILYGVEEQMIRGAKPVLGTLEPVEEWPPKTLLEKYLAEFAADELAEEFDKASPFTNVRVSTIISPLVDWNCIKNRGRRYTGNHYMKVYGEAMGQAGKLGQMTFAWDVTNERAVAWAAKHTNLLVQNISNETRASLQGLISRGIAEGQSIPTIGRNIRPLIGLNNSQMKVYDRLKLKLEEAGAKNIPAKLERYKNKAIRYRGEMIARTETARAMSAGTIQGYKEAGVKRMVYEASADACIECLGYDGHVYTLAGGSGLIPVHPNCRCTWRPIRKYERAPKGPAVGPPVAPPKKPPVTPPPKPPVAPPTKKPGTGIPFIPGGGRAAAAAPEAGGGAEAGAVAAPKIPKPKVPRKPRAPRKDAFSSGGISSQRNLGGGVNMSEKVHIGGDGDGIFKPAKGEMGDMRGGIPGGTYYKREVAASIVDEELKFNLVPKTVIKEGKIGPGFGGGRGVGSVQKWVDEVKEAQAFGSVTEVKAADKMKLTVFDVIIGNTDRHPGNILYKSVRGGASPVAIDNGLAFPSNKYFMRRMHAKGLSNEESGTRLKTIFGFQQSFPDKSPALLRKRVDQFIANRKAVSVKLESLLSKPEIDSVFQRAEIVAEALKPGGPSNAAVRLDHLVRPKFFAETLKGKGVKAGKPEWMMEGI